MIIKKISIPQNFPDPDTVNQLSGYCLELSDISPVFYDIETTGLSRDSSAVYLIGAVIYEENAWQLYQWFAEHTDEEPDILREFSLFLASCSCTIQYNGDSFDQPFVTARCKSRRLPDPFGKKPSLDLYRALKPLKSLLNLPSMRQPDLERFLGYKDRQQPDGEKCIRLYRDYTISHNDDTLSLILGHNREDLTGLCSILPMLGYLCLYHRDYYIKDAYLTKDQLLFLLRLPVALPQEFSAGGKNFYLSGKEKLARLLVTPKDGRLRRFYENFRDYDYIPGEDMAIPKSLSSFMDKSLRKAAAPDTCYTWFPVNEAFLSDRNMQTEYLSHALPVMLRSLGK